MKLAHVGITLSGTNLTISLDLDSDEPLTTVLSLDLSAENAEADQWTKNTFGTAYVHWKTPDMLLRKTSRFKILRLEEGIVLLVIK